MHAKSHASSSSSAISEAIPEREAWRFAPPKPAASTSPLITSGVSSGEERNNCPFSSPNMVKSESDAASADAPTTGPQYDAYGRNSSTALDQAVQQFAGSCKCIDTVLGALPTSIPHGDEGGFARSAISTIFAILRACISPMLPP